MNIAKKTLDIVTSIKEQKDEIFSLPKGKYDINYVINLLKIIESKCENGKLTPSDLRFSLQQSCKLLRGNLEIERDVLTDQDPIIRAVCKNCKETSFLRKSVQARWVCPNCPSNLIEMQK